MKIKRGVRPKNGSPKIIIRQKVSLIKFKDKDGNYIFSFSNQGGVLKPTVEVSDVKTS